ncbi:hypothetical protein V9K67_08920 [Paraflavisolibacter sp. H34]|uniref:hypothetical protein n=1 Tax=Huijunlia imazamoxiresistens TaxID=3127457 RepID=UPI003019CED5
MPVPPILMIAFNRPMHAQKVFEEVRKARPGKLYIAVDGPRKGREEDVRNIGQTIKIFDAVDWPCEVVKLIREENLGCKLAVSSAITWFFQHEEQGIILEDDCLPSPSFFDYCDHLLEKFKHNDSVMHISGVNFQDGNQRGAGTYYFSRICHVWGWASWRRAWEKYDIEMTGLETFFDDNLYKGIMDDPGYWKDAFYGTKKGAINTWDYQWVYSIWKNNGLCIAPNLNLISNIGFDQMATHTKKRNKDVSDLPAQVIKDEIKDCHILIPHYEADRYSMKKLFRKPGITDKIKWKLSHLLPKDRSVA